MNEKPSENEITTGWDAIDKRLQEEYHTQIPQHYAPQLYYSLGGEEPLDGISVYVDTKHKCYHYITYGFSELYEKETDDAAVSGYGFELTFRLKFEELSDEYPTWPIHLLQNIAKITFSEGLTFGEYQTLSSGPIRTKPPTAISAILFVVDPSLKTIATENGGVEFLQIFGLTASEYKGIVDKTIDRRKFLGQELIENPLLITNAERK